MNRLTVKELKRIIKNVPDDAIVCCQSDEEGNRTMVCCRCYVETVGKAVVVSYNGGSYAYTEGEDVEGIDLNKDKGTVFITLRPLY